ncbi:MAG TPA: hypothetical protein VFB30_17150 [Spirochaetia bacterium]|nr:hypothetical protein [Spirochaetia bacterium]
MGGGFGLIRQWFESRASGVERRLGKVVERTGVSTTVKNNLIEVVYILGIVVMSAGIVSALASPVNQSYTIYPSTNGETVSEMIIYSMAMMLGFGGLYLSYLSGRQTVKPRLVPFFLILGLILIGVAVYIEMYVFFSK